MTNAMAASLGKLIGVIIVFILFYGLLYIDKLAGEAFILALILINTLDVKITIRQEK